MSFNPLVPSRNRLRRSDPFALLQNEIDVLFDDFGRGFFQTRSGDLVPRVDVSETENALEVTAELPGLELKDVQIEFSDDVLTIKGEKKSENEKQEKNRRVTERRYGSFFRAIPASLGNRSCQNRSQHRERCSHSQGAQTRTQRDEKDRD